MFSISFCLNRACFTHLISSNLSCNLCLWYWFTKIKKLMQMFIVIVSGSILNFSTVHLNGIWHLIWLYLLKPVLGGHPVLSGHYSIPLGCPLGFHCRKHIFKTRLRCKFRPAILHKEMNTSKCGKLIQITMGYYWVFSKMVDLLSVLSLILWSSTFQDGGWVKFPTLRTFRMSNSLPTCASLSLISVGCPPPSPSWGKPLIGALGSG